MSPPIDVVRSFLTSLRSGDLDAACALISADAVIDEAESLPFGGVRKGRDGFRALASDLGQRFRLRLGDQEVREAGPLVLVTFEVRLESRRTRRFAEMAVVDLYTVEDGLIDRLDVFYKDTHRVVDLEEQSGEPDDRSGAA